MSAVSARAPGSIVTIARSPPNGMTTVVGVRGAGRDAIQLDALRGEHVPDEVARDVVPERRGDGRAEAEAGCAHRRDRAAARRAEELGGESLLAELGERLEPDERQIEKDRGGDDEVGHGRSRIDVTPVTRRACGSRRR